MSSRIVWLAAVLVLIFSPASPAIAQIGPGNGNGNGNGQNQGFGGILIDTQGVITAVDGKRRPLSALKKAKAEFLVENLEGALAEASPARTISLNAIAREVANHLDAGTTIPEAVLYLGGLTRIDHIILDRDNRDVLLSGPAEGFVPDDQDRRIGLESGRPVLVLEDLIVALRARRQGQRVASCSIDPTPENMARLQNYLRQNSSPTTTSGATARFRQMDDLLGMQEITVEGVPDDSRFARIIVEADLRMKRIALGTEPSGVKGIRSHLSMLTPQGNTLQRWWFIPLYDPLQVNADRSVFKVSGPRAQLLAQEEVTDALGNRSDAGTTRQSVERFAQQFTQHFPELADQNPAFAELQTMFDFMLLAGLLEQEGVLNAGCEYDSLVEDTRIQVTGYAVPKYVRSQVNHRKVNGGLLIGLIGGVTMNVDSTLARTEPATLSPRSHWQRPQSRDGQFWWSTGQ